MSLTDNIPKPLQRKVGPFPIWVWVTGVGGGLLLYYVMSRRTGGTGSGGGDSETAEPDEFDFESAAAGPAAPYDSTANGTNGTTSPQYGFADFAEPAEIDFERSYEDAYDTADLASGGSAIGESFIGPDTPVENAIGSGGDTIINKYITRITRRPTKKRRSAKQKPRAKRTVPKRRNVTPRQKQAPKRRIPRPKQAPKSQQKRRKSFAIDEPHIDYAIAPNGAPPTVTTYNMPAIGIASPDRSPRRKMRPLNSTRAADSEPFIASKVPPAPISRAWGRPFHGTNRNTQAG